MDIENNNKIQNTNKTQSNNKKILFLHGYTQNSLVFQKRLKVLTKTLTNLFNVDFLFPEGQYIINQEKENTEKKLESEEEIQRGWTHVAEYPDNFFDLKEVEYIDINQSIDQIQQIFEKNTGIECIFAFSQGSLLALLVLAMMSEGKLKDSFKSLKCAVLASGFISPFPTNDNLQFVKSYVEGEKKISLPTLHIYGKNDDFVKSSLSERVTKMFESPEIFEHDGKHFVPSKKDDIEKIVNYLGKYLEKK